MNFATAEAGAIGGTLVCGPICGAIGGVAGFGLGAWGTAEFWNWYNNEDASDDASQCDKEREKSRAKGIPDSEIGPSGKPKIHNVDYPSKKKAKDAANNSGKGKPMHHPSPTVGKPHYHPTDANGNKIPGTHHNY